MKGSLLWADFQSQAYSRNWLERELGRNESEPVTEAPDRACMSERSVGRHQPVLDQRRSHPKAQARSVELERDLGMALGREHPFEQR